MRLVQPQHLAVASVSIMGGGKASGKASCKASGKASGKASSGSATVAHRMDCSGVPRSGSRC